MLQSQICKDSEVLNQKNMKYFMMLFVPILIEQLFQALIGNIDVLLISQYSDKAVAALGVAGQILVIGTMILGIVSIGTTILLTQLSSSKKQGMIENIIVNSVYLNIGISVILFLAIYFQGYNMLKLIQTPNELLDMAYSFLKIVGFSLIFQGIMTSFGAIFRSFSYVKNVMQISILTNVINLVGNSIVVFTPISILGKGVVGVANSTLISRMIAAILYIILFRKLFKEYDINIFKNKIDIKSVKLIFKLGLPSGMESISYNVSQTILTGIIAGFGTVMITAKIYTQTMTSFVFTVSCAISMTIQIIVGRMIGSNFKREASKYGIDSLYKGVTVITLLSVLLVPASSFIVKIYTNDQSIMSVVSTLVILSIFLEPARVANCILISNLNSAGDVKFPVIVGIVITYCLTIPLSYLFSVVFGWGIYGIWIVSSIDEWIRASIFYIRWKKEKWTEIDIIA